MFDKNNYASSIDLNNFTILEKIRYRLGVFNEDFNEEYRDYIDEIIEECDFTVFSLEEDIKLMKAKERLLKSKIKRLEAELTFSKNNIDKNIIHVNNLNIIKKNKECLNFIDIDYIIGRSLFGSDIKIHSIEGHYGIFYNDKIFSPSTKMESDVLSLLTVSFSKNADDFVTEIKPIKYKYPFYSIQKHKSIGYSEDQHLSFCNAIIDLFFNNDEIDLPDFDTKRIKYV